MRRILYAFFSALFVRFPLWLLDATVVETGRRSGRAINRSVRKYAPWAVGLAVLALLHATGVLGPLLHGVMPILSHLIVLAVVIYGIRWILRSAFRGKKGRKK